MKNVGDIWESFQGREGRSTWLYYNPQNKKYEIFEELMQNTPWKKTKGKNSYNNWSKAAFNVHVISVHMSSLSLAIMEEISIGFWVITYHVLIIRLF